MKVETSLEPCLDLLPTSPGLPSTWALEQGRSCLRPWNPAPSLPHTYQLLSRQDTATKYLMKA